MKYKIIPDDIVKNMIEFLDEIQFEAAAGSKPSDLQRINFCNWMADLIACTRISKLKGLVMYSMAPASKPSSF